MFKNQNNTRLCALWVPCVIGGLSIYLISDIFYPSKPYECVNTESINNIEYYNTKNGYKVVNQIINFINVDSKIYVMFDKTIPINETFECYITGNNINLNPHNTQWIVGIVLIVWSIILIIIIISYTYVYNKKTIEQDKLLNY